MSDSAANTGCTYAGINCAFAKFAHQNERFLTKWHWNVGAEVFGTVGGTQGGVG